MRVKSHGEADAAKLVTCIFVSILTEQGRFALLCHSPTSRQLCSCSPIAISCTLVQKSGPEVFGTLKVQLPPFTLRRSSHMGWKPCLKRYIDSRILIFSTGVLLLYRQKSCTLSICEPICSRVASYVPSFFCSFCCLIDC
jgi:hypothetical protein